MTTVKMTSYITAIYVVAFLTYVNAFYNGASHLSCEDMDPGINHGTQGPNPVPYSIDIPTATSYTNGQQITVEIKGAVYTGIMLQARRKSSTDWRPVGWFSVPLNSTGLKLMTCVGAGDTITQKVAFTDLQDTLITWVAPDSDVGEIEFVGNVFKDMYVWYKDTKSKSLPYQAPVTTTTTTTTPSSLTTTTPTNYYPTYWPSGAKSTHKGAQTYVAVLLTMLAYTCTFG